MEQHKEPGSRGPDKPLPIKGRGNKISQVSILYPFPHFVPVCASWKLCAHKEGLPDNIYGCLPLPEARQLSSRSDHLKGNKGCSSWQPGLYQRQAGSLVQSPDSTFSFLWLSKAGGWQGNIVSCEGSSCTGSCGACRWEEDSGPWDLLLMGDPALETLSCEHLEVENIGSCSWSWVWILGIQPQTSK